MKANAPDGGQGSQAFTPGPQFELDIESPARELIGAITRRRRLFFAVFFAVLSGGAAYVFMASRYYTATAHVLIDARHNEALKDHQSSDGSAVVASPEVDSQVEIIKSARVAATVVRKLDLTKNEEFLGRPSRFSPMTWIRSGVDAFASAIGARPAQTGENDTTARERQAISQMGMGLDVERINLTYVVEVNFRARDPKLAAAVANAVATAYIEEQLEARYATVQRANAWLNEHIQTMRQRQLDSERAVAAFRARNNIVDTGGPGGRTVNDQQLVDLNASLSAARAQTAEAFAKWQQIQRVVTSGDIDAPGLTDALNNPVIHRLHQELGDLERRKADRVARVGPEHRVAVLLNDEISQVRQLILSELRTVEGSVRNEYEIAKNREETLAQKLNAAIAENARTNVASIELRDLQREADANRTLYETFLTRYVAASEQQSFPVSEARVLAEATPPLAPSHPKVMLILGAAFGGGAAIALAFAMVMDRMEPGFRSRRQAQAELGVPLIGLLPFLDPRRIGDSRSSRLEIPKANIPPELPEHRQVLRSNRLTRVAVESVLSRYADGLRAIRQSVERTLSGRDAWIIGVISAAPGEGKSTFAVNFAQHVADSGERTLLIDADFRRAALTTELAAPGAPGASQVLLDQAPLPSVVLYDPETGLEFLPSGEKRSFSEASELANSRTFQNFVKELHSTYAWTILDLPPLVPVVDAQAVAEVVDGYILVVEWGVTPRSVVVQSIESAEALRGKLLGCVFNKVELRCMAHYESHMRQDYYSAYYD